MITKQVDGHKYEPFEEAVIEVPEEHVGPVVDMLGQRKGQMLDLIGGTDTTSLTRLLLHRLVHAITLTQLTSTQTATLAVKSFDAMSMTADFCGLLWVR